MSSAFEALLDIMESLNITHQQLLELAEEKKTALIHNEVDQLIRITNQENKAVKRIAELDTERVKVIGEFMIEKGFKPNPRVSISDLTKIIFQIEDKKKLMDAQKRLLGSIRQLKTVNQLNQQMITHSLAFINYSLDLYIGPPEDDTVYQHPKQAAYGKKSAGFFDSKA